MARAKRTKRIRHLIVVRHGERVDSVFPQAFRQRQYERLSANMPRVPPIHGRLFKSYEADPFLTEFGIHFAKNVGELLQNAGIAPDAAYSSPALRSVQTASYVALSITLRIVPSFVENWWPHAKRIDRAFLSPRQLAAASIRVDQNFRPTQNGIVVSTHQTSEYRERFGGELNSLIVETDRKHPGGAVMIVGHGSTADCVMAHQIDGKWESYDGQGNYIDHFEHEPGFCHIVVLQREDYASWSVLPDAVLPYISTGFTNENALREEDEKQDESASEESDTEDDGDD